MLDVRLSVGRKTAAPESPRTSHSQSPGDRTAKELRLRVSTGSSLRSHRMQPVSRFSHKERAQPRLQQQNHRLSHGRELRAAVDTAP